MKAALPASVVTGPFAAACCTAASSGWVVFELAVTAVAMRYPRTRMIALGILLTGLGFAGFGIFVSGLGMALAVTVWSFGEMFGSPSAAAFVAELEARRSAVA